MSNTFIKHITLENFKSIKKLDLELKPLNVLIGSNGAGKSNFISFFNYTNILPYIQPHEFEALCFADIDGLAKSDPFLAKNKSKMEQVLKNYNFKPENINTIPSSYPAKQLEKFGYSKASINFAQYCSIDKIKSCCPHFNEWIVKLQIKL